MVRPAAERNGTKTIDVVHTVTSKCFQTQEYPPRLYSSGVSFYFVNLGVQNMVFMPSVHLWMVRHPAKAASSR